jgi:hypothetical protein
MRYELSDNRATIRAMLPTRPRRAACILENVAHLATKLRKRGYSRLIVE